MIPDSRKNGNVNSHSERIKKYGKCCFDSESGCAYATGRRKTSSARVRITPGKGKFTVNKRQIGEYFPNFLLPVAMRPFDILSIVAKQFDVVVNVTGGGVAGQAGAVCHGLSRALSIQNEEMRLLLKKNGLLTRDARMKERKKPGQVGARTKFQYSKR